MTGISDCSTPGQYLTSILLTVNITFFYFHSLALFWPVGVAV